MVQFLLILFLTLLNAFFAGSEMAVVSVNKNRMKVLAEEGNKKAKKILKLFEDSTRFLSTIQVAITFAGFFNSASAATGVSTHLARVFRHWKLPYSGPLAVIAVTLILSYFTLVFGELIPKRIALQKAEKWSLFCVGPVSMISKALKPFIALITVSTNGFLHLIGMKTENLEEQVTEEEIRALLETGSEAGVFNDIEKHMINSIFSFDDKVARDVMVPRREVYALDIDDPFGEYMDEILETRHSRIPVYKGTIDNIIGVFHVKDFVLYLRSELKKHETLTLEEQNTFYRKEVIQSMLHEPYFVPEMKKSDELFLEMQKARIRMALLIDEYGGFSGLVTIEDLVEEIMGDILEEHEKSLPDIQTLKDGTYLVQGSVGLEELSEVLHEDLESENYDTLSGYLIEKLDYIPDDGSHPEVQVKNLLFKIKSIEERRIHQVIVEVLPEPKKEKEDEDE